MFVPHLNMISGRPVSCFPIRLGTSWVWEWCGELCVPLNKGGLDPEQRLRTMSAFFSPSLHCSYTILATHQMEDFSIGKRQLSQHSRAFNQNKITTSLSLLPGIWVEALFCQFFQLCLLASRTGYVTCGAQRQMKIWDGPVQKQPIVANWTSKAKLRPSAL